jgi:predicted metalloprotease with PDZ domain
MIKYRIDLSQRQAHVLRVVLTVDSPAAMQQVSLPVWIAGSYLVREFSRHLSGLQARQGAQQRRVQQLDKATWQVACQGRAALVLSYEIYAFDMSVRTAFLSADRAFFNGTSVCLRVHGHEMGPHQLQLHGVPKSWQVATTLPCVALAKNNPQTDKSAPAFYQAVNYEALVDHPFELGTFWQGQFKVAGVVHEMVVTGAWPQFDGARLIADVQRICAAEIAFWHGATAGTPASKPPFKRYVFMLNAVHEGYGGLEHRASTALLASRRDLPEQGKTGTSEGYVTLLGLVAHEYFHTWNVKRLRPLEFVRHDHTQENYTELLWFFEGFTSYYDDLFLLRTGLIDGSQYLALLSKTINSVLSTPGRQQQSVAQASFDAWVKYYRSDENTPNSTISYYSKGALVALAFDLLLRTQAATKEHPKTGTLDDVMRSLWQRSHAIKNRAPGSITEADIVAVLSEVAGQCMQAQLNTWVHGTQDIDLQPLLEKMGVAWAQTPPSLAQRLGLRVSESALTGIKVNAVLRGSVAEHSGVSAGDEILAVDQWRIRRLDEATPVLPACGSVALLLVREQRMLTLQLPVPPLHAGSPMALNALASAQLSPAVQALRQHWWHG